MRPSFDLMGAFKDPEFLSIAEEFIDDHRYHVIEAYMAHRDWTLYEHCCHVASIAYQLAKGSKKPLDIRSLVRASFLHDFYFYDWHLPHKGHRLHGFRHPDESLKNAQKLYPLNPLERRLIRNHMFPLTFWRIPTTKEERILMKADRKAALYEHHRSKAMETKRAPLEAEV